MRHMLSGAVFVFVLTSSAPFVNAQPSEPYNYGTWSNPLSRDLYGRPVVPPSTSSPSYGYGGNFNSNPYEQPSQPRYTPTPAPSNPPLMPHDFSVFDKGQYKGMCTATKDAVYCY